MLVSLLEISLTADHLDLQLIFFFEVVRSLCGNDCAVCLDHAHVLVVVLVEALLFYWT